MVIHFKMIFKFLHLIRLSFRLDLFLHNFNQIINFQYFDFEFIIIIIILII